MDVQALAAGLALARAARLAGCLEAYEEEASGAGRRVTAWLGRRLRDLAARAGRPHDPDGGVLRGLHEVRALVGNLYPQRPSQPIKRFLEEVLGGPLDGVLLAPSWGDAAWTYLLLDPDEKLGVLYFDGADAGNPLMWPLLVRACLGLRQTLTGNPAAPDAAAARLVGPALLAAAAVARLQSPGDAAQAVPGETLAGMRNELACRGTLARFLEPFEGYLRSTGGWPGNPGPPADQAGGAAAFGPADLEVAEMLLPRLADGILIAARRAPQATAAGGDIYAELRAVEEVPNTPAQIVNAAWLYYTLELLPRLPALDFDRVVAEVAAFDTLIGKSLLVAGVHRFYVEGEKVCAGHTFKRTADLRAPGAPGPG